MPPGAQWFLQDTELVIKRGLNSVLRAGNLVYLSDYGAGCVDVQYGGDLSEEGV